MSLVLLIVVSAGEFKVDWPVPPLKPVYPAITTASAALGPRAKILNVGSRRVSVSSRAVSVYITGSGLDAQTCVGEIAVSIKE
jgi:hypothetical protein